MIIHLYSNGDDSNVVNKTLANPVTISGSLRDSTSILDPTILINIDNPSNVNYMYIPDFRRYYFIKGITCVRTGLWALSGHVDVLMSWNSQLRNLSAVIARTEEAYRPTSVGGQLGGLGNLYLEDERLLTTVRRNTVHLNFPNRAPSADGKPSFVLTVAGGNPSS